MYSNLALQARPNSFPHPEIDVGTFKWSRRGQVDHVMGLTTYFDLSRPVLQTLPRLLTIANCCGMAAPAFAVAYAVTDRSFGCAPPSTAGGYTDWRRANGACRPATKWRDEIILHCMIL